MGSKQGGHGRGRETKSGGNSKGNWKKREKATSPREAHVFASAARRCSGRLNATVIIISWIRSVHDLIVQRNEKLCLLT